MYHLNEAREQVIDDDQSLFMGYDAVDRARP